MDLPQTSSSSSSWTVKHRPNSVKDLVGNINIIKDGLKYLKGYKCLRRGLDPIDDDKASKFSKGILITGPNGVGKTEFARLLALYRGYIPFEFNTSDLRLKNEVSAMVDLYQSDVRFNFNIGASVVMEAKKNMESCGMGKFPLGKAIIIDELDAMTKGQKGIQTALMSLLNDDKGHTPDRLIILTCADDALSKFKTIKNHCYCLALKQVSDSEIIKLIDRVCDAESIELKKEDKEKLATFANGDCRRLLNSMEICFTNGMNISDMSANKVSKMISKFVNGDTETLTRLKLSSLSTEKLLDKVIRNVTLEENSNPWSLMNIVRGDSRVLSKQLFQTYPSIIRQDIPDAMDYVELCSEAMSYADLFVGQQDYDAEQFIDIEKYTIYSVLEPLIILKGSIANNFKMKIKGYAKIDGETRSMSVQYEIRAKLGAMSKYFAFKTFEELRHITWNIAIMLKNGEYEKVSEWMYEIGAEPTILEELIKIKILNFGEKSNVKLSDIWKTTMKRKLKKCYVDNKPATQGLKYKDGNKARKIMFFEKYTTSPHQQDDTL